MIEKQKSSSELTRAVAGGEYGTQPLDVLMRENALSNSDVVKAATVPVTHKMVQKARLGRRLSRKVQLKVVDAINATLRLKAAAAGQEAPAAREMRDLFTYDGR